MPAVAVLASGRCDDPICWSVYTAMGLAMVAVALFGLGEARYRARVMVGMVAVFFLFVLWLMFAN